jgi:hypothetical protein
MQKCDYMGQGEHIDKIMTRRGTATLWNGGSLLFLKLC